MKDKSKAPSAQPLNNPFGALQALKASLPSAPESATASATASAAEPTKDRRFAEKVVVRKEKKGHGGKTVTVVSGVVAACRSEMATALKKALGTGAREDGDDIVMQGDLVDRVIAALEKEGARTIVRGSK